ncbi:MAG: glycosyl hydrolase, partial [Alphaproteobacteria bacterium]
PVTFPKDESQLPRPQQPGAGLPNGQPFSIAYSEGATVGYKWYDANKLEPLFPFGHALSYTDFDYSRIRADLDPAGDVTVTFSVKNDGRTAGKDVPQIYVSAPDGAGWEAPKRLGAFQKVNLAPGQETALTVTIDPRLLAVYSSAGEGGWRIAPGEYKVMLGVSSRDIRQTTTIRLPERWLPVGYRR